MHRALILTKYPDEYQRLIEAEQLPGLAVLDGELGLAVD